jgi:hypothetical protein
MASVVFRLNKKELARCSTVAEYMVALHTKNLAMGYQDGTTDDRPTAIMSTCSAMGRGLSASRSIEEGEFILAERALVPIHEQGQKMKNAKAFALAISGEANQAALSVVRDMHNSYDDSHQIETKDTTLFDSNEVLALEAEEAGGYTREDGKSAQESADALNDLVGLYFTNAHRFSGLEGAEKCGMLPMIAMVNHSCDPNIQLIEVAHMPNTIHAYARRSVREGDVLTVSYINSTEKDGMQMAERRELLKESFMFDCMCSRCVAEGAE